jgi:uncharacterized protein (TIGR00297 family)
MTLTRAEATRKVVHIAVGSFALLLRWMTWPQAAAMALAAFLFNWQVWPRLGGRAVWRDADHGRGYPVGILLYPVAVLGLVLVFRDQLWKAAAVWGVLAWGDGMATLVGRTVQGPALPWNRAKTWAGFAAFTVCGGAAAAAFGAWTLGLGASALGLPAVVATSVVVALAGAIAESLPLGVDDNLTVAAAGAVTVVALDQAKAAALAPEASLDPRALAGLLVSALVAAAAWRLRALDAGGALSLVVIGTAVVAGVGWSGLAVMAAFFVSGTLATRLGYARKAGAGIAQEKGGARGWRNVWANGAVPVALAVGAAAARPGARALWVLAYAAAVATAAADTCSTEIGKAYGRRTLRATTLRPVPPGTAGGISLEGTLGGLLGAALVAATGAAAGLFDAPAAALVACSGLAGSLVESVLGSLARPRGGLGGHLLNLINTAVGAALIVAWALAAR